MFLAEQGRAQAPTPDIRHSQQDSLIGREIDSLYVWGIAAIGSETYDKAISWADSLEKIYTLSGEEKALRYSYELTAKALKKEGNYHKTQEWGIKAIAIAHTLADSTMLAESYRDVGIAWFFLGELDSSFTYFSHLREIYLIQGNTKGLIDAKRNIVNIYKVRKELDIAIKIALEAFELVKRVPDYPKLGELHYTIGSLYLDVADFEGAEFHFRKGLDIQNDPDKPRRAYIGGLLYMGDLWGKQENAG